MMTTICAFCLSNDRNLTLIDENYRKMVDFYLNSSEDDVLEYLQCLQSKQALQICWECSTKLKNMHQFISTSQQCIRVLNTYLEASTQILPATTSKLYRTHIELVDTGPMYKDFKTEDIADTIDEGVIYEQNKTEDVTDTETEDVADTIDTWPKYKETETEDITENLYIGPIYEETEIEDVTDTLDVKMNDPLETELNNIPDNHNGEVINSDIKEDPGTSVDLEKIKEQVVLWRVILHRLPTDTPANIMSSGTPVTICDGTNSSRIKPKEDVPRVEALHEVTDCILKQHTTKEHEKNISKEDKVNNKTIILFKIPEQKKTVSLSYICDHCKRKYNTKIKLQQHLSIHYGVSKVNVKSYHTCQTCNYRADTVQALEKHSRLHDEKRRFKCNSCTYRFSRNAHLMNHVPIHTGEKSYKCDFCNFASSRIDYLQQHVSKHTGEKQYKCIFCDYASVQKSNLKKHTRLHTGEKPYKCDSCNFASSRSDVLKLHMSKHTGEKQYQCVFCDYASIHKGYLKKHTRIHTGEKPYKCVFCEYASSRSDHLKQHMNKHTGEKRHKVTCASTEVAKVDI